MHVIGHEHGADKSLPGRAGLAFVGYGVSGAPNEGAIMENREMYSTPITLASHENRHNESLLRY